MIKITKALLKDYGFAPVNSTVKENAESFSKHNFTVTIDKSGQAYYNEPGFDHPLADFMALKTKYKEATSNELKLPG